MALQGFGFVDVVMGAKKKYDGSATQIIFPPDATQTEPPYPLLSAAEAGKEAEVEALIKAGADANLRSKEGWSPLIMAAKGGHVQILQRLISLGATINPPDVSHTALRGAALSGRTACVKVLLEEKADPAICSVGGKTALMGAAMTGHYDVVELLLTAGADQSVTNSFGETARQLAVKGGHRRCVAALDRPALHGELGDSEPGSPLSPYKLPAVARKFRTNTASAARRGCAHHRSAARRRPHPPTRPTLIAFALLLSQGRGSWPQGRRAAK